MKGLVVRLIKADLRNIKNVEYGSIDFISYNSVMNRAELSGSDIIGIYGQNGSGKTTMIESLDILKHVHSGLSVSASDYAGIIDADGMFNITSLVIVIDEVATPSTPFASVYATDTGIITSALTLAQLGRSVSGSISKLLIVPCEVVLLALMKVNGYVGFDGVKFVMFKTISLS